ncbi:MULTISPECIES: hypothetical protein [Sphingobacterium]|uniref:hypothetical protein n=1 Tax=Sphingobacterium TaxID=28453 RepID=UPI00257C5993|nr:MULTISPECIES: hypothetical protein [Sphingobacterium]
MKRLLSIILFAMLAIRSQAQFVSSFSDSYKSQKEPKIITLDAQTQSFLNSVHLPSGVVDSTLAPNFIKDSEKRLRTIIEKRKEFKILAEIDDKIYKEVANKGKQVKDDESIKHFNEKEIEKILEYKAYEYNQAGLKLETEERAYREAIKYYQSLIKESSINKNKGIFPFKTPDDAVKHFYGPDKNDHYKLVQDVMVQRNFDGSNSLNSELFSAIVPIPSIPIKLAIGSTITQVDEKKIDSTNIGKNKLPYGGFFNATFTYPFVFTETEVSMGKFMRFYIPLEYKFNIDEVKDNQPMAQTYNFHELSSMFFFSIDLVRSEETLSNMNLFAGFKTSYYFGNGKFADRIGSHDFSLLQFNTGVKIAGKFTIGFNIPVYSSSTNMLKNQAASIALKFQPGI